jgi:hypothetical protein
MIMAITTLGLVAHAQEWKPKDHAEENRTRPHKEESGERMRNRRPWMRRMQELQEQNPELFEEMKEKRKENPAEFARWLREEIAQRRRDAILEKHTAFRDFFQSLDPDSRQALERDLFHAPPKGGHPHQRPPRNDIEPQIEAGSMDPEVFDAQTKRFEQEIERAEKRVEQLRELLQRRKALRDKVIQD